MQVGHQLQINCLSCNGEILFSVLSTDLYKQPICCQQCSKKYAFDEGVLEQLRQFEALCRQIHASKEILGKTNIAIDIFGKEVKIPYKILLTRLSSEIDLKIGPQEVKIRFRVEPLSAVPDVPALS